MPYALALAFGADPIGALPNISYSQGESATSFDTASSPELVRDALGVSDSDEARELAERWALAQRKC